MPTQPVSFGLASAPGRFGPDGGAKLINCYAEQLAPDAKSPFALYCRPGLKPFADIYGSGGFRGAIDLDGVAYVVCGAIVNKVTTDGAVTNVGTFAGTEYVHMARNRKSPNAQIALVSDGLRSILSGDSIAPLTDEHLPPPNGVCSIGGYFVFSIDDGRYFWTSIDEGTEIDALDFASAEANPDGLVGIIERTQEIVLLGEKTIEFHALTGTASVFERVQQTTLRLGCLSAPAVKSINGIPIFPATDCTVRMLSDYSPERISMHDVERDIDALTDKSVMTAQTFSLQGHQFYCLNSPNWTWVCDLLTRNWQQWESYGEDRWNAEGFVEIGGKRLTGHYDDNKLYEIDPATNDDDGGHLIWKATSGPVGAYPGRIIADELYLDLLPGVGLNSSDPHEKKPKVVLRTSDDDGKSWSDEMKADVGEQGDFTREVSFLSLGASGQAGLRFEMSMSAPVSRCLTRAALRYTPLAP